MKKKKRRNTNTTLALTDETLFEDASTFAPERWLSKDGAHKHQFAFGIGGRMCVASHLAHKALYAVFLHLIAHFEIIAAEGDEDDAFIDNPLEGVAEKEQFVSTPRGFAARLVPRDVGRTRGMLLGLVSAE